MRTSGRPSIDERVLELLERFRQMTRVHLLRAGVNANADYLGERLLSMEKRRLIYCIKTGVDSGKLPYLYALAPAGADRLAQAWKTRREQLHYYRQRPTVSLSQFTHRNYCILAHVVATTQLGEGLLRWTPEYGASQREGRAPTLMTLAHGRDFRPDALFAIDHGERGPMAYALEVHNSTGAQRHRLLDQLESHRQAQGLRLASAALGLGATYAPGRDFVTLVLMPDDVSRNRLSQQLKAREDFRGLGSWFRCKTFTELDDGFSNWHPLLDVAPGTGARGQPLHASSGSKR